MKLNFKINYFEKKTEPFWDYIISGKVKNKDVFKRVEKGMNLWENLYQKEKYFDRIYYETSRIIYLVNKGRDRLEYIYRISLWVTDQRRIKPLLKFSLSEIN